jgi:NAD(P)-dependent dehydrogenase (short-subunit alcohol dehydrogenase family)
MKLKPIRNQIVILMGASSGIGRQAALDFVGRGARHAEISMMAADTSMYEELKEAADAAVRTYGRINTWVQLAGANLCHFRTDHSRGMGTRHGVSGMLEAIRLELNEGAPIGVTELIPGSINTPYSIRRVPSRVSNR